MAKHLPSVHETSGSNLNPGTSRKKVTCQSSAEAPFVQTRFLSVSLQTVFPLCSLLHVTSGRSTPVIKHDLGLERWLSSYEHILFL